MAYTWYTERYSPQQKQKWTLEDYSRYGMTPLRERFVEYRTSQPVWGRWPWNRENFVLTPYGYLSPEDAARVQYLEKEQLKREYMKAFEEAKKANEERYKEILRGYESTYGRVAQDYDTLYQETERRLRGLSDAEIAELRRQYELSGQKQLFNLAQAGLYNTTIAPTVQRQNMDAAARAEMLAREKAQRMELETLSRLKASKLDALTQLELQKYGVMERREDVYPNLSDLIALSRGLGEYPVQPTGVNITRYFYNNRW